MQHVDLHATMGATILATPDMTIMEAADMMERHHARAALVGNGATPLGYLSEDEIVAKVLATGLDPNLVHVKDVMLPGRLNSHGAFLIEEDPDAPAPIYAAETLHARDDDADDRLISMMEGRCEECGVYSLELRDHDGLEMCEDCGGFRQALFG